MQITIDTNNLSELDIAMLAFLAEQGETAEEPEEPAPPAKSTAKKTAPKDEVPAPADEEAEEDLVGNDGPTLADAVARATVMVSNGNATKVKEALAVVGAKRVSEMKEEDIPAFFAALDEE